MLLAGDVGGTKTLVGLFAGQPGRPEELQTASFRTADFSSLGALLSAFLQNADTGADSIEGACFGVAGPVTDGRASLTNVPWTVDASAIGRQFSLTRTNVINDLEALAWSVTALNGSEIAVLSPGQRDSAGAAVLVAAGTGLGVALLLPVGGRLVPLPSEGGHADFAARNQVEDILQLALRRHFGRAELEQVLSGPGLVNIHRYVYPHACTAVRNEAEPQELPPLISAAALEGRCADCRRTLEFFVSVLGATCGNLALTALATGGVYIGGGIAPHILTALEWPVFLESFRSKSPLDRLMPTIPVSVILNPAAGLLGAAVYAATHK